jgi:hypothetical protein
MRKILYSPGYGAGWVSWNSGSKEFLKFMLEYQPIIEAIERGDEMGEEHPAVKQLCEEAKDLFGQDYVCVCGADKLQVYETDTLVIITDHDGYEEIEELYGDWI